LRLRGPASFPFGPRRSRGLPVLVHVVSQRARVLRLRRTDCSLAIEYSVRAIDAKSGKVLGGISITLRYACTTTGSGIKTKIHCKFIQRRTGADGVAHFPEAGTLSDIDDIFPSSTEYGEVCCDISRPVIPGIGTITFRRRSFSEMLHWIFIGD
jgi:hypothetical protein